MIDPYSYDSLAQQYPRLHAQLKQLQVTVAQLMLGEEADVRQSIDILRRWIAMHALKHSISPFEAAARIFERTHLVEVSLIVALAAALEAAADDIDHA